VTGSEADTRARATVADYGIDAQHTVVLLGLGSFGAGLVMAFGAIANAPTWLSLGAFASCVALAIAALVLIRSSRVGRLRERIRFVDRLELDDDSYVLDAGCGTGMVLVEAARRIPEGLAVGVDDWLPSVHVVLRPETPLENAQLEAVDDRVVVTTAGVGRLPFADEMFDGVSCSLVLRRLANAYERLEAVREAARVLVPGGRLVVLDTAKTREIVIAMRSVDLVDVTRSRRVWRLVPPARYVIGSKPSS
jgi:SAM-dependent methyltransferase